MNTTISDSFYSTENGIFVVYTYLSESTAEHLGSRHDEGPKQRSHSARFWISLYRQLTTQGFTYKTTKVCQMLSWWTKNSLYSINICYVVTEVVLLCSLYQAPSYESNIALLGRFLPDFAYWRKLFILEMVCTAVQIISIINSMQRLANPVGNCTNEQRYPFSLIVPAK